MVLGWVESEVGDSASTWLEVGGPPLVDAVEALAEVVAVFVAGAGAGAEAVVVGAGAGPSPSRTRVTRQAAVLK